MKPTEVIIEGIGFDRERVFIRAPFFHDLRKIREADVVIAVVNQVIEEHDCYPAKARVLCVLGDHKANKKWDGRWVEVDYSAWADSLITDKDPQACSST